MKSNTGFDNFIQGEVNELSFNEIETITGGESGWYYLGKLVRAVEDGYNYIHSLTA